MLQPGERIILVLKKDLLQLRRLGTVRMINPGSTWCEVKVDEKLFEEIKRVNFWYRS